MRKSPPTIKGIFVKSHVDALVRAKGKDAVGELIERCGKQVRFQNSDDVPIRTEILIIEHVLDMLAGKRIPKGKREFEAGRLHFRNFAGTRVGEMVLMFRFKSALQRAPWIARRVFRGVQFSVKDLGKNAIEISMSDNDYPLEHFHGFFKAWMQHKKLSGTVRAKDVEGVYMYALKWK